MWEPPGRVRDVWQNVTFDHLLRVCKHLAKQLMKSCIMNHGYPTVLLVIITAKHYWCPIELMQPFLIRELPRSCSFNLMAVFVQSLRRMLSLRFNQPNTSAWRIRCLPCITAPSCTGGASCHFISPLTTSVFKEAEDFSAVWLVVSQAISCSEAQTWADVCSCRSKENESGCGYAGASVEKAAT